jgi:hypothetical protein
MNLDHESGKRAPHSFRHQAVMASDTGIKVFSFLFGGALKVETDRKMIDEG